MSDVAIATCLVAIALLSVLLMLILLRRADGRRPPLPGAPAHYIPFPADLHRSTLRNIAPAVGLAFVFGLLAFHRIWAAVALAFISFAAGTLAPRWLWHHVQSRR